MAAHKALSQQAAEPPALLVTGPMVGLMQAKKKSETQEEGRSTSPGKELLGLMVAERPCCSETISSSQGVSTFCIVFAKKCTNKIM